MRSAPVVPAQLAFDAEGLPRSTRFDDRYHPRQGALAQARRVFLEGNGLPGRWAGRERFVVLETGFGLGNNFLATWDAWRGDPERCGHLHVLSIEAHPLRRHDLAGLPRDAPLADLAAQLEAAWPPLTFNLHRLVFEAGRVELLLAFGDVAAWLPRLDARVDAFFLDGFAPAKNPAMWTPRVFKAMGRMAARGATAATWSAARGVRDGLRAAGFDVAPEPGTGGKREITTARFAPRFAVRARPRREAVADEPMPDDHEPVIIVGGGLAGCATALALAAQGRRSVILERQPALACEASGNAAGLFHGVVHGDDALYARFHRASALAARAAVAEAVARHGVRGNAGGLLRLQASGQGVEALQALVDRQGLPPDYVRAVSAREASALAGLTVGRPAWLFPGGGWVDPGGLCRAAVEAGGGLVEVRCGQPVAELRRVGDRWQAMDEARRVLARSPTLVLANAGDAARLAGAPAWLQRTRGQVSGLDASAWPAARSLALPIAGSGYVLPPIDGRLWFGATATADDGEATVRLADHRANLARLAGLTVSAPAVDPSALVGRVGFRWSAVDRLPLVGAVPAADVGPATGWDRTDLASVRPEQPRFAPRSPGLFVIVGLGSRGIAGSTLGAQVLAAWITGAPMPLEADLLDAIDPARFASRAFRRRC